MSLSLQCGLSGLEWAGDVHVPCGNLENAARVGQMTRDAGLEVASYGSYFRAGTGGQLDATIATAAALGAPNIRVWAGAKGSEATNPLERGAIIENLKELCSAATELDMTVGVEYHTNTLTDTVASLIALVGEVDRPNFNMYWQPFPERSHSERAAELAKLLPFVSNLHVFQWTKPADEVLRHPLAEGNEEWPFYLQLARGHRWAFLEFIPGDEPVRLATEAKTLLGWLS